MRVFVPVKGDVVSKGGITYSNVLEAHADDEVGGPVGTACHSHGGRSRTLREQLSHKEPGDGTWTDLKEGHEAED